MTEKLGIMTNKGWFCMRCEKDKFFRFAITFYRHLIDEHKIPIENIYGRKSEIINSTVAECNRRER
jgi:hypothetical protein